MTIKHDDSWRIPPIFMIMENKLELFLFLTNTILIVSQIHLHTIIQNLQKKIIRTLFFKLHKKHGWALRHNWYLINHQSQNASTSVIFWFNGMLVPETSASDPISNTLLPCGFWSNSKPYDQKYILLIYIYIKYCKQK